MLLKAHNAVHDHKDPLNYTGLLTSVVQARFQTLNCIIHFPEWSSQLPIRINSTWQKIFSKRKKQDCSCFYIYLVFIQMTDALFFTQDVCDADTEAFVDDNDFSFCYQLSVDVYLKRFVSHLVQFNHGSCTQ